MMTSMTLYQELVAAGCEIDHHESDLYILATKQAEEILKRHRCNARRFMSSTDGKSGQLWWEAPFMYDPFWSKAERISPKGGE